MWAKEPKKDLKGTRMLERSFRCHWDLGENAGMKRWLFVVGEGVRASRPS